MAVLNYCSSEGLGGSTGDYMRQKTEYFIKYARYAVNFGIHNMKCGLLEAQNANFIQRVQKSDLSPLFVVGAGRSGNTLLARLLHETGGVHFGPENFSLSATYLNYLRCIDKPWEARVATTLDILGGQVDSWRWEAVDVPAVKEHLLQSTEQTLGNIIHTWYEFYGKSIRYPSLQWGCKTPNITPFIPYFKKVFPNARIIQIVRKPEEVISSFEMSGIEPYQVPLKAAIHWDYFNRSLLKIRDRLVVTYDRLVERPSEVIEKICRECSINIGSDVVEFKNPDLFYEHLENVNSVICKRERISNDDFPELAKKYASYIGNGI